MQEIDQLGPIADQYQGFLFDAYGVLFDGKGLIKGAARAWQDLSDAGKKCWILTNGSSRTLEDTVTAYRNLGLSVELPQIINSASLLASYLHEEGLEGAACAVLGTEGSKSYLRNAGALVVDPLKTDDYQVVVVANQTDYPLLETIDTVLSQIIDRIENDKEIHLILTNPDLIYPNSSSRYGITAGSIALLFEAGLKARFGCHAPQFEKLGKPFRRIFAEAIKRAGHKNLLMIGDQVDTDIRGATLSGLDSLLVGTGMLRLDNWHPSSDELKPKYILKAWRD